MRTSGEPSYQGQHASGSVSRTEWARGLFFVFTLVVVVALVCGAAFHADALIEWLGAAWLAGSLALYVSVTAADVRRRPHRVPTATALRRALGFRRWERREIVGQTIWWLAFGIVIPFVIPHL